VTAARKIFAHELRVLGVPEAELNNALKRVTEALLSALDDPRARWVLSPHQDARTEWRLSGVLDGKVVEIAIDRSFVEDEVLPPVRAPEEGRSALARLAAIATPAVAR
jgi:hypothetical protein